PLTAVVLGALLAVGTAVALSPLFPIGPAAQVEPSPGLAFDWTVLGAGFVVLVAVLAGSAVVLAYTRAARRRLNRAPLARRHSSVVSAAARTGLPAPAVAGLRFSLERGHGR